MPGGNLALGEDGMSKADMVRWSLFTAMVILGLLTIIIGMVIREAGLWDWKFVS